MAHSSLKYDPAKGAGQGFERDSRRGLGYEKLGVIAGFLVGLPVGVGLVDAPLTSLGAPDWLGVVAAIASVAVFTAVGLKVGRLLGKKS